MNRILLQPDEIFEQQVVLRDERARHIRRVLRKKLGERVRIGVVNGPTGQGMIQALEPQVTLEVDWDDNTHASERPAVNLLLALPRPKVLKRLWAQLAALGVDQIFLTNAEKVERCYFDSHVLEEHFIERHLLEGLQQCGETALPRVSVQRRLKVFLEDILGPPQPDTIRLLAHPGAERRVSDAVEERDGTRRILLAVGPEGGWTDYECDLLMRHGFCPVASGSRILRTDTACISLIALAHDALRSHTDQ
jgi:RsmE family RNA methyltransferase